MAYKQLFLFLVTGGAAAGLNWGSRFVFSQFVSFETAIILSFIVGLLSGFFLMRTFVFDGTSKAVAPQVGRYIFINLIALAQTLTITLLLAEWLLPNIGIIDHTEALAHFAGVATPLATSYFGHKWYTFR